MSYEQRLDTLRCWRLRADPIEVYKIMKGIEKIDRHSLFPKLGEARTKVRIKA